MEMSRTRFLRNVWIVGKRDNILKELKSAFEMKDVNIQKIMSRIESLCINSAALHENHVSTESMINLLITCYTPPENVFVCHVVSKTKPHLSFIRATTKRTEMQIREDNCNRSLIESGGDNSEARGFIHGFVSNSERKDLEKMFVS